MNVNPLRKAIEYAGSARALAEKLDLSPAAVSNWVMRGNVPARHVIPIERATNGRVTRYELRPDLYPKEDCAA